MFYNHRVKNSLLRTAIPTLFDVPHPPPQAGPKRPPPTPRENLPIIKKAKVNNIVLPANESGRCCSSQSETLGIMVTYFFVYIHKCVFCLIFI